MQLFLYGSVALFYLIYYTVIYPLNKKSAGKTSDVAFTSTYDEYRGKIGYVSEDDLENGIKLRSKYDKDTRYVATYAHTSYDFMYQPTKQKDGTPIGVLERNVEKIVSLKDNTVYNKSEFFNDQIDFMGFLVKYGNTDFAQYTTVPHVVSNYQDNGIFYSDAKTAYLKQTLHTPGATIRVKSNKVYKDAKYFASVFFMKDIHRKKR